MTGVQTCALPIFPVTGDWDLVCCGHDHEAKTETITNIKGGTTWVVNPGTVGGVAAPATWVLGDLETMQFDLHEVVVVDPQVDELAS